MIELTDLPPLATQLLEGQFLNGALHGRGVSLRTLNGDTSRVPRDVIVGGCARVSVRACVCVHAMAHVCVPGIHYSAATGAVQTGEWRHGALVGGVPTATHPPPGGTAAPSLACALLAPAVHKPAISPSVGGWMPTLPPVCSRPPMQPHTHTPTPSCHPTTLPTHHPD